jgi:hypothetical protein
LKILYQRQYTAPPSAVCKGEFGGGCTGARQSLHYWQAKNSRLALLRGARDANEEHDAELLRETAEAMAINLRHLESAPTLDVCAVLKANRPIATSPCSPI